MPDSSAKAKPVATIYDVAASAGVSHQTVSRYLSGFEGIRPATRRRVELALDELDYRPNLAARALRRAKSNRIGVIAHDLEEAGPARVIRGAFKQAQRQGYLLDIILVDIEDPASLESGLAIAFEQRVDGILALAQSDEVVKRLMTGLPDSVVAAQVETDSLNTPANERSGWLAADHILKLGHPSVGYVSGPSRWNAARARQRGFEMRLAAEGMRPAWVREGDWSARSGYELWNALSDVERDVTAVAAANDSSAVGLIAAVASGGRLVPADVSVIGTDDITESGFQIPALTTIHMDHEGQGAVSVASLIAALEGTAVASSARFSPPALVVRDSTVAYR